MFVVIINFPPIKAGKDAEFREWFVKANKKFSAYKGFISQRLLKPLKGGNYAAIVEHESRETFMAMHDSPPHAEENKIVETLLDGKRSPTFYEVIVG